MTKDFTMLGLATSSNESRKSSSDRASRSARTQDSSNDFVELIRSLFQHPSAIAIVGSYGAPDRRKWAGLGVHCR